MAEFFREEIDYNAKLMVKYQYFLSFLPAEENVEDDLENVIKAQEELEQMRTMRDDEEFERLMNADDAEQYGLATYGIPGGRHVRLHPGIMDARIEQQEADVEAYRLVLERKLRDAGMSYDGHQIVRRKMYPFDDVKALDLHHLGYDFPYEVRISSVNVDRFVAAARDRYEKFAAAKEYLIESGQAAAVSALPETDVMAMREFAERISGQDSLPSNRAESGQYHRIRTLSLGSDYGQQMKTAVESTVAAMSAENS